MPSFRSPEETYAFKPNIVIPATEPSLDAVVTRAAQHAELVDDVDGGSGPQRTVTRAALVLTDTLDGATAAGQSARRV